MNVRKRTVPGRNSVLAAIKTSLIQSAGILSYVILLIMRIPLSKVIGDAGVGLFAPAFEIFMLVTFITSYSVTGAMSGMIRYRVKREQHRNARRVFGAVFIMDLVISSVIAAVLVLMASKIADFVILESLSRMAVLVVAPTIVLAALIGTFRGFFNGYGLGTLTAHSQYIEKISMFLCALGCGRTLYAYGNKVSALRQNAEFSFAHGAMGAMLGVLLSQVITTIDLLIIYLFYSRTLRDRIKAESGKGGESQYSIQRTVLLNCIPMAIVAVFTNLFMLIDQRMFNYCMNKRAEELGEIRTASWGAYYGKFAVLIGAGAALCLLGVTVTVSKIKNAYDKEDYRIMRERLDKAVCKLSITAFPIAVYLAALAEAIVMCLYKHETAAVGAWIQKGAVIIVLCSFSFFFAQLLFRMHMLRELFVSILASMIVHILVAYLFVQKALLGADGIIYALIAYFAVFCVMNFLFISRNLRYQPGWFTCVAFPAAAAVVSGLVVMLIGRFMLEPAGAAVTILTGIVAGIFLDLTMLMILRVIGEEELSRIPLGFFFIMFGKNIGVL